MKKLHSIRSLFVLAALVVAPFGVVGHAAAQANTTPAKCDVVSLSYAVGADTVTANFAVRNTNNGSGTCTQDVTVAAWNAPNGTDGVPFNQQTLNDSKSGTFTVGNHSLTVKKPKCFYQIDLLRGLNPNMLSGSGATINYADWQYVSSAHGGQACVAPTPVTPAAVTPTPVALPNTGPGSVVLIAGAIAAVTAVAHNLLTRRKYNQ